MNRYELSYNPPWTGAFCGRTVDPVAFLDLLISDTPSPSKATVGVGT